MLCQFAPGADGWRCSRCGWLYRRPSEKPPRRNCPAAAEPAAVITPRTEAEQAACRAVCLRCEQHDPNAGGCVMDCQARRQARYTARLARGDCPIGRWGGN